ncbi:hypothetical protein PoB_000478000 [Plakobranchus ocellatus]|uniref:Uncharacterized protein n=1 Tax=Plakobranchus ocellatus TaxID=259542 RepID=A0AAV3Y5B4_9GAST|nr:hypothetical protein PoB_000478000 [Plakobranchus ocellatus]
MMRKLFTVGVVDNIDRNLNSTTAPDSLREQSWRNSKSKLSMEVQMTQTTTSIAQFPRLIIALEIMGNPFREEQPLPLFY